MSATTSSLRQSTHAASRLLALLLACSAVTCDAGIATTPASGTPTLVLKPCRVEGVDEELRCGSYEVFENRQVRNGRKLPLKIVLVPARDPKADRAPVFHLAGGPGETNTDAYFIEHALASPYHADHDIVLVDSRGTGDGHRLACSSPRSDEDLSGYLQTPFAPEIAQACHRELEQRFDLSQYSTAAMVEDLDEVRQALGYDRIKLEGGSFGTYAALMYMRAHGERVRSAYLVSLVTLDNRVPLYHAAGAQWALDRLFEQCAADAACHAAYPQLRSDLAAVQARLRRGPVRTSVRHPVTGAWTEVELTERAFTDAVRVMMYSGERGRGVPALIAQARAGDFDQLAEAAIDANRGFYNAPLGLHYAVTCNEFVHRIRPQDVAPATRGSYAGDSRVRDQMASCAVWPKTALPDDWFTPFRSDVPALLVSGDTDPAAPPRWGEAVHAFLPNSRHIVVPGGHVPGNACTGAIAAAMFRAGSITELDFSCVSRLRHAPFELPPAGAEAEGD